MGRNTRLVHEISIFKVARLNTDHVDPLIRSGVVDLYSPQFTCLNVKEGLEVPAPEQKVVLAWA